MNCISHPLLRGLYGILIAAASIPAMAVDQADAGAQIPTLASVEHIETKIIMPAGASSIKEYTRYYEALNGQGHPRIVGFLVRGGDKTIHLTDRLSHFYVADGNCTYVHIFYESETDTVTEAVCGHR